MSLRFSFPFFLVALLIPTVAKAQEAVAHGDQYSVSPVSQDTVMEPDGGMTVRSIFRLSQFADDPNSPFNHLIGYCSGTVVLEEDESAVGAAGGCHMVDSDGSGYWQWWQLDEGETEECPVWCGTYGDYNGYGKFEGYTGKGTWEIVAVFADGSEIGRHRRTVEWK